MKYTMKYLCQSQHTSSNQNLHCNSWLELVFYEVRLKKDGGEVRY